MDNDNLLTALHESGHVIMALAIAREFIRIRSVTIAQTADYKGITECADGYDLTLREYEWQQADGIIPIDNQQLERIHAKAMILMKVRMAGPVIELMAISSQADLQNLFRLPTLRDDAANINGFLKILPGDADEIAKMCWQYTIEMMIKLRDLVVYLTRILLADRTVSGEKWTLIERDLVQRIGAVLEV